MKNTNEEIIANTTLTGKEIKMVERKERLEIVLDVEKGPEGTIGGALGMTGKDINKALSKQRKAALKAEKAAVIVKKKEDRAAKKVEVTREVKVKVCEPEGKEVIVKDLSMKGRLEVFGLNTAEVAKILGYSQGYVSTILRGKASIKANGLMEEFLKEKEAEMALYNSMRDEHGHLNREQIDLKNRLNFSNFRWDNELTIMTPKSGVTDMGTTEEILMKSMNVDALALYGMSEKDFEAIREEGTDLTPEWVNEEEEKSPEEILEGAMRVLSTKKDDYSPEELAEIMANDELILMIAEQIVEERDHILKDDHKVYAKRNNEQKPLKKGEVRVSIQKYFKFEDYSTGEKKRFWGVPKTHKVGEVVLDGAYLANELKFTIVLSDFWDAEDKKYNFSEITEKAYNMGMMLNGTEFRAVLQGKALRYWTETLTELENAGKMNRLEKFNEANPGFCVRPHIEYDKEDQQDLGDCIEFEGTLASSNCATGDGNNVSSYAATASHSWETEKILRRREDKHVGDVLRSMEWFQEMREERLVITTSVLGLVKPLILEMIEASVTNKNYKWVTDTAANLVVPCVNQVMEEATKDEHVTVSFPYPGIGHVIADGPVVEGSVEHTELLSKMYKKSNGLSVKAIALRVSKVKLEGRTKAHKVAYYAAKAFTEQELNVLAVFDRRTVLGFNDLSEKKQMRTLNTNYLAGVHKELKPLLEAKFAELFLASEMSFTTVDDAIKALVVEHKSNQVAIVKAIKEGNGGFTEEEGRSAAAIAQDWNRPDERFGAVAYHIMGKAGYILGYKVKETKPKTASARDIARSKVTKKVAAIIAKIKTGDLTDVTKENKEELIAAAKTGNEYFIPAPNYSKLLNHKVA